MGIIFGERKPVLCQLLLCFLRIKILVFFYLYAAQLVSVFVDLLKEIPADMEDFAAHIQSHH